MAGRTRRAVPMVDANRDLMVNVGKSSRNTVMVVFEMIGGADAMAAWAEKNKGDFYTKLFPKIIGKEVEHVASDSVEKMLEKLDAQEKAEELRLVEELKDVEDAEIVEDEHV